LQKWIRRLLERVLIREVRGLAFKEAAKKGRLLTMRGTGRQFRSARLLAVTFIVRRPNSMKPFIGVGMGRSGVKSLFLIMDKVPQGKESLCVRRGNQPKVKLPGHRPGLPGKEMSF
jgi:hypothetical protein